jgi:hypothetical protein
MNCGLYKKKHVNDLSLPGCYVLSLSKHFVTFHVHLLE